MKQRESTDREYLASIRAWTDGFVEGMQRANRERGNLIGFHPGSPAEKEWTKKAAEEEADRLFP